MKPVKTITITAAFILALSGGAFAQGSLGDSGTSGGARGRRSAVGPKCRRVVPEERLSPSPSSGTGFGSSPTGSSDSSLTTPNGNPVRVNPTTGNGRTTPADASGR